MIIKNGTLFCEGGSFRTMDLKIQNGHIAEIGSQLAADGQESLDATNCYVVPGLVDIHIHGAVGADFPPNLDLFLRLQEDSGGAIRTVAVAPETEGGLEFVEKASRMCSVSLAHSCADYETSRQAFARGANHVTHVFNGMPAFHHRDPGIVGAAVGTDAYVELICDGVHVHPAVVQSVFRLFGEDRVCLISDAMRACGMPDGEYDLGGQAVTVANGCATIATGSLAGSITVLTDCLRRAVGFGIPLEAALKAATINPARSVGLDREIGSLACGKQADILVLDRALSLRNIVLNGELQAVSGLS